ncbi:MAG: tetratricopeptide repeat protein [Candidatus Rokubacteria bacterium]|nr:tetratricopeptide repeat protein [Candidatus Rokubacteria bacterium]
MRRRAGALLAGLAVLGGGLASAAPLLPVEPPAPDLVPLLRLAAPPLDKPPVRILELPLPAPPEALPALPAAAVWVDLANRPAAPLPEARKFLPCVGTFLKFSSELLECGRARFAEGDLKEARAYLEAAAERGEGGVRQEARFLLGETFLRLNQLDASGRNFLMASQENPHSGLGLHGSLALGLVTLQLNDPARAVATFERLLAGPAPYEVMAYASHGRALALYARGRYAEARDVWHALFRTGRLPPLLDRELSFWFGETLGRVGDYAAAEDHLRRFTGGGSHALLEPAMLRLGWWALAAGHPAESAKAFQSFLAAYPSSGEHAWARFGLVRAFLALDDLPAAEAAAGQLRTAAAEHPLAAPGLLLLLRASVENNRDAQAQGLVQELLGLNLSPASRAYALLLNAEVNRRAGQSGEARSQFELTRSIQPAGLLAWHATLRIAQMDLEAREFSRALAEVGGLLSQPLPPELAGAALLLRGEAAYRDKVYQSAAEAFGRFVAEFRGHPEAAGAFLSLAWAEFRLGRLEPARQRWLDFAWSFPRDPRAGEALLLAAELAAQAGDLATAGSLLDQFLSRFPVHPHAPIAKLNRAILELRAGQYRSASTWLKELTQSVPLSPFVGRMRLATGVALLAAGSPAEATAEFNEALKQGEDVLAHLGLGSAALALRRWAEAERHFLQAREAAGEPVRVLAEYGAAAAAFHEGKRTAFPQAATAFLASPYPGALVPRVVYALAAVTVEEKRWAEARHWTLRLVNDFPGDEAADDALARLGAGAVAVKEWPLVVESYQLLLIRYPGSPHAAESRLDLAEALLRTGAPAEARGLLESFVASAARDPRLPRALLLLAEAQEATGERAGAVEALARLVREEPRSKLAGTAQMARARLLQELGRWDESRQVLEQVLGEGDAGFRGEAAFRLGEGYRARSLHAEAVEAYMTAAYLAPQTPWARRALLAAGQSFEALKESSSAVTVYRKLLAQPSVEPELAAEARKALQQLGQSP